MTKCTKHHKCRKCRSCTQHIRKKTVFCKDVKIKKDLTVCGSITEKRDRFHGWWRAVSKGNPFPQVIFVDTVDSNNPTITIFDGVSMKDLYQYPDKAIEGPNPIQIVNDRTFVVTNDISVTTTVDNITGTYPNESGRSFVIQEGGEYDGLLFWANNGPFKNESRQGTGQGVFYEKLNFDMAVGDQIRPWGNGDNAFRDANSRIYMFEQLDELNFKKNVPAAHPDAERLMPQQERLALRNEIIQTGVDRFAVEIFNINKTTKGSKTTTLLIKGVYPLINEASKVTLSGLTGDWSDLNDTEYQVGGIYQNGNTDLNQAPFYLADTAIYQILIWVDTTDKPRFVKSDYGPSAIVKPNKVGPVTEDMSYMEFIDAGIYYLSRTYRQSSHARLQVFLKLLGSGFKDRVDSRLRQPTLNSWKEVSNYFLNIERAFSQVHEFKGAFGSTVCPSFYLPFWATFFNTQINEPFEELGIPGSNLFPSFFPDYSIGSLPSIRYNVPIENYILPESRRWLYFRVKPDTPVTNEQQENVWALANYDGAGVPSYGTRGYASVGPNGLNTMGQLGGSRLEGFMSPTQWGSDDTTLSDGFWSPYTQFDPFDPQTFNSGLINPEIVGGKNIGYITTATNLVVGDPRSLSWNINFGNPDLALSPDPVVQQRQQYDGSRSVISALMKYFNEELEVDALIIDNRINLGGFNSFALMESFGDIRKGSRSLESFQFQDNRPEFIVETDVEVYGGTRSDNKSVRKLADTAPWGTIRPDIMDDPVYGYPGSVFKDGCIIVLSSMYAASGGDLLPRYFLGDNGDGYLGNGVQAHLVGAADMILDGFLESQVNLVRSKYGSEFPDTSGIGQSPVSLTAENLVFVDIGGVKSNTRLDENGVPIKFLVPKNSNIVGPICKSSNTGVPQIVDGALSLNVVDTVYFDFGYTGPGESVNGTPFAAGHWDNPPIGLNQVGGFPGQPEPNDLSSLRDSWLEESIRVAKLCLGEDLNTATKSVSKSVRNYRPTLDEESIKAKYADLDEKKLEEICDKKLEFMTKHI